MDGPYRLTKCRAKDRKKGHYYYYLKKGELKLRYWNGKKLHCEHKRLRNVCKECGGASFCKHGRRKHRCKECGGGSICEHNRLRSQCKECGGGSICEHNRLRSQCKECGGGGICEHNRSRSRCKECGGGSICEHKRIRSQCKECGGAVYCEHNIRRAYCKECVGSQICKHKKIKQRCIKCSPDSSYFKRMLQQKEERKKVCKKKADEHRKWCEEHKEEIAAEEKRKIEKRRDEQRLYNRSERGQAVRKKYLSRKDIQERKKRRWKEYYKKNKMKLKKRRKLCTICNYTRVDKLRLVSKENKKVRMCVDCFYHTYPDEIKPRSKYKRKQHYIHEKLKETYGKDFFKYDKRVECGCSRKIPDWFCDCFHFVLNIECDEEQHKRNETSCENKRLMELFLDCANRPFVCIRFNPDKYTNNKGDKVEGCFSFDTKNTLIVDQQEFERRWNILKERIDYFLECGPDKEVELEKLFYDGFD